MQEKLEKFLVCRPVESRKQIKSILVIGSIRERKKVQFSIESRFALQIQKFCFCKPLLHNRHKYFLRAAFIYLLPLLLAELEAPEPLDLVVFGL